MTTTARAASPNLLGSLLRVETGVGRVRSMRHTDAESPFVAVTISVDRHGDVAGVIDMRVHRELFPDSRVLPVAVALRDTDVAFRIDVRRSAFTDPSVADDELTHAQLRRWVSVLRPATPADDPSFATNDLVLSRVARNAIMFTFWLRQSLAGLCQLGSVR